MKNEDIMKLDNEQLEEVTGGKWDEELGIVYEDGVIDEMGGRTAFVKFDIGRTAECGYAEQFAHGRGLDIGTRVRVQMKPIRTIIMILE